MDLKEVRLDLGIWLKTKEDATREYAMLQSVANSPEDTLRLEILEGTIDMAETMIIALATKAEGLLT